MNVRIGDLLGEFEMDYRSKTRAVFDGDNAAWAMCIRTEERLML